MVADIVASDKLIISAMRGPEVEKSRPRTR